MITREIGSPAKKRSRRVCKQSEQNSSSGGSRVAKADQSSAGGTAVGFETTHLVKRWLLSSLAFDENLQDHSCSPFNCKIVPFLQQDRIFQRFTYNLAGFTRDFGAVDELTIKTNIFSNLWANHAVPVSYPEKKRVLEFLILSALKRSSLSRYLGCILLSHAVLVVL